MTLKNESRHDANLSMAPQAVITTTNGATRGDKVGIFNILGFYEYTNLEQCPCWGMRVNKESVRSVISDLQGTE